IVVVHRRRHEAVDDALLQGYRYLRTSYGHGGGAEGPDVELTQEAARMADAESLDVLQGFDRTDIVADDHEPRQRRHVPKPLQAPRGLALGQDSLDGFVVHDASHVLALARRYLQEERDVPDGL